MLAIVAAVLLAAAPSFDTVYTQDGGRLVGTVIEEAPQGVSIQLPDGTTRRLERREVTRIEYADGSVSTPNRPPPPPPPPAYRPPPPTAPPPPPYAPPPPPPAYRPPPPAYRPPPPPVEPPPSSYARRELDPFPLYGAFGLGGAFMSGRLEDPLGERVPVEDVFGSQLDIWLEGGLRLNPHLGLGLYVDVGVGEPAREVRALYPECDVAGTSCSATTARVGLLLRHTFNPRAPSTPWIAVGTGFDFGSVSVDADRGDSSSELFDYSGWEVLRLMAGVDLRSNPVFGVGLYGGVAFGRYSQYEDDLLGEIDLDDDPFHTTVQAGIRFTLFP